MCCAKPTNLLTERIFIGILVASSGLAPTAPSGVWWSSHERTIVTMYALKSISPDASSRLTGKLPAVDVVVLLLGSMLLSLLIPILSAPVVHARPMNTLALRAHIAMESSIGRVPFMVQSLNSRPFIYLALMTAMITSQRRCGLQIHRTAVTALVAG